MTGIVTPEAVRLDFESANLGSRCIALLLDLLLQGVVLVVVLSAGAALSSGIGDGLPDWVGIVMVLLLVFAVLWGYPIAFETLWRGRTLGKAAVGLRVVTREGAPVRFRHAAIRAALSLVDLWLTFGGAAVVSILATPRQQRLGDLVAGTLVLRERTAQRAPAPVRFAVPPGAESYAASIDASGMTADDYADVRAFLLRAASLAPDARARIGTQLARRVADKLAHTPPQGVTPELFLVAAATRYQQRTQPGGTQAAPRWPAAGMPSPAAPGPVAAPSGPPAAGMPPPATPSPGAPQPSADAPASDPSAPGAEASGGFVPPA